MSLPSLAERLIRGLGIFYLAPKFAFDVSLTSAAKPLLIDSHLFASAYYIVVCVKDMGTASKVFIGFSPDSQPIPLDNSNSAMEVEAPASRYVTTTDIYARTDAGTATVTVWGVLYD